MENEIYEEWGSSQKIGFITSQGIKYMEPGKSYDRNLNEQPERSKREDFYGMKATVSEDIITFETGEKFDLNQPIEDAVL